MSGPQDPIEGSVPAVLAPVFSAWALLLLTYHCQHPPGALQSSTQTLCQIAPCAVPPVCPWLSCALFCCPAMLGLCNWLRVLALPFSPGNMLWAPPRGCGWGGPRGTPLLLPLFSPFLLPPAKVGSQRLLLCPAGALVPMGTEVWAMGFAGALVASALPCAAPARAEMLEVGAGHPKTGHAGGSPRQVPPGLYLFIPSGAAPSGEAPAQPWLGAFSAQWGWGGSDSWGGACHHMGGLACVLLYIWGYYGLLGKPGPSCACRDTMEHNTPSSMWLLAPLGAGSWRRAPKSPGMGSLGGCGVGPTPLVMQSLGVLPQCPGCTKGWVQCLLARTQLHLVCRGSGEQHQHHECTSTVSSTSTVSCSSQQMPRATGG